MAATSSALMLLARAPATVEESGVGTGATTAADSGATAATDAGTTAAEGAGRGSGALAGGPSHGRQQKFGTAMAMPASEHRVAVSGTWTSQEPTSPPVLRETRQPDSALETRTLGEQSATSKHGRAAVSTACARATEAPGPATSGSTRSCWNTAASSWSPLHTTSTPRMSEGDSIAACVLGAPGARETIALASGATARGIDAEAWATRAAHVLTPSSMPKRPAPLHETAPSSVYE